MCRAKEVVDERETDRERDREGVNERSRAWGPAREREDQKEQQSESH